MGVSIFAPHNSGAQCAGIATTPKAAADCAAQVSPQTAVANLDPGRPYTLAELVDIGEQNNPKTHVAWEQAKQTASRLGIERSAYFPVLVGIAAFGDQKTLIPFPEALVPHGYITAQVPFVQPEVTLQYLIFDFGNREAKIDIVKAKQISAGAHFIQANQDVAYEISKGYYKLVTAQERLEAAKETLKTAQTTQDAAEDRLKNGRATLPDVLNARAQSSQAAFDLESADGDEKVSRVSLAEALGVEPSPNIVIDAQKNAPLPESLTLPIEQLIDRAVADRPDLAAQAAEIRAADREVTSAKANYLPRILLNGSAAQTSIWPSVDYGVVGHANQPTWTATLAIEWRIFDGGERKNNVRIAESKKRAAEQEFRGERDKAIREVWTAYIAFRTAIRQEEAAVALLDSANSSYSASLDAYRNGVRNLVDVVTAENQLSQARLSSVSARSRLFLEAVNLEFVTGNLLRHKSVATQGQLEEHQN